MKLWASLLIAIFAASPLFAGAQNRWWNAETFYEIFVRSFQDSDGDGIGDLPGVTQRLDYLQKLGVGGLWLTPIFPSRSYHGYDAVDFKAVDPAYGTLEDLRQLTEQAHRRGIKVILDIAVLHTSKEHPWFRDAKSSTHAEHRNWYVWRHEKPKWGKWYRAGDSHYLSQFGSEMPQLNWKNPAVGNEVKQLLQFWMEQGVDGFRLDAARYYVTGEHGESDTNETHQRIAEFVKHLRDEFSSVLFVGEIWAETATINGYCKSGRELDLAFDFPGAYGLIDSINQRNGNALFNRMQRHLGQFKKPLCASPFLTNHDMDRAGTVLAGDQSKLKLAAEIYLTQLGTPFLYYGEELGVPNGSSSGDLAKRSPMQWDESDGAGFSSGIPWQSLLGNQKRWSVEVQESQAYSLLKHYRYLIHFRKKLPMLTYARVSNPKLHEHGRVLSWLRTDDINTLLFVANFSGDDLQNVKINAGFADLAMEPQSLHGGGIAHIDDNGTLLRIEHVRPTNLQIFKIR